MLNFLAIELQCLSLSDKKELEITELVDTRKLGNWNIFLSHPMSQGKYNNLFKNGNLFIPSLGETRYLSMVKKVKLFFISNLQEEEKYFKYFHKFGTKKEVLKVIDSYYYQPILNASDISIIFSMAVWLLKDSSVSPAHYSFINFESKYHSNFNRTVMYTDSLGRFKSVKLNDIDLEIINRNFSILFPYMALVDNNFNEAPTQTTDGDTTFFEIDKALSTKQQSFTRALLFIQKARLSGDLQNKITQHMSALQCLFAVKKDISFNLSRITASLIGKNEKEQRIIIDNIECAYGIRSEETHGSSDEDISKIRIISKAVDSYLRRVIKKVVIDYSHLNYLSDSEQREVRDYFKGLAVEFFKDDYLERENNQARRRSKGIGKNLKNIDSFDELEQIKNLVSDREKELKKR